MHSRLGLDIGGTQLKMVLASATSSPLAQVQLTASALHPQLTFTAGDISLTFVSSPTNRLEETVRLLAERMAYPENAGLREIVAAGGGAHKYGALFREVLQVKLVPFRELQAAVRGLCFLSAHGPDNELFTVGVDGHMPVAWPRPLFPCVLVNMGSGVSVVRVDGEDDFCRVGGTACGGATFLGLARALSGVADFDDLIALAARGDACRVDKTVGDIYGDDGCVDLGMTANLTAASFGKLAGKPANSDARAASDTTADMAAALLKMVAQASVVLAKAYATQADCLDRVFFAGGFLQNNELARAVIGVSMANVGGRAIFCRHSEFLGALGSLSACLRAHGAEDELQSFSMV